MRFRFAFSFVLYALLPVVWSLMTSGCSGSPIDYEKRLLSENDPNKRLQLVKRISESAQNGSKYAVATLRKALADSNQRVRREAIEGLLLAAPSESDDAINTLQEEIAAVRDQSTATAMRRVLGGDKGRVAQLLTELDSEDVKKRIDATETLATPGLDPTAAVNALNQALRDQSRDVRLSALSSLAKWGPLAKPDVPTLRNMLGEACQSVTLALRRITAYDSHEFELSSKDQQEEVGEILASFKDLPPEASAEAKGCARELAKYNDKVTILLSTLVKINGDCFDFKIKTETNSYELYKNEVHRFMTGLTGDYAQMCESIAIRRLLKAGTVR